MENNINRLRLLTLDKKLFIVNHRMTRQQIQEIQNGSNVDLATVEKEIQKQIYFKFLDAIVKNLKVEKREESEDVTYTVRGFVLSERLLYEILLEVCELDSEEIQRLKAGLKQALGIFN